MGLASGVRASKAIRKYRKPKVYLMKENGVELIPNQHIIRDKTTRITTDKTYLHTLANFENSSSPFKLMIV